MSAGVIDDFASAPITAAGLPTHSGHMNRPSHDGLQQVGMLEGEMDIKGAGDEKTGHAVVGSAEDDDYVTPDGDEPTTFELSSLRKVPAAMAWPAIAMCLIEFAERASYYGTTGPFSNFVKNPLPKGGSGTGAVAAGAAGYNEKAGALGLGSVPATAITTSFKFLAYTIPIFGGIVADTKWGRFKTIVVGTAVGAVAHILLVVPAIPAVISSGKALGPFIISVYLLAFAAGFIKPSLGPLLCDQAPRTAVVGTNKKGERVIIDPQVTVQRYLLIFYWCINIGAFFALATSYAERDVGFWLAYLLPGIVYCLMPIVLVLVYKRLYKAPPQGSVVLEAFRVVKYAMGHRQKGQGFWDAAKPSSIVAREGSLDINTVFWDDTFVDEIKQSLQACLIFVLIPIFSLSDGGIGNAENDMSNGMFVGSTPNDLIGNFNSLTIVFFTPVLTWGIYPWLEKMGYPMKPMWRMFWGFVLGGLNMVYGAILQWKVYQTSPCGYYASSCETSSPVSLWLQIPLYAVPAIGELLVNVTSYEIAYTRAPARMKGLVYALNLFNTAIAAAISLALSKIIDDPYLIWSYVAVAIACFVAAPLFPTVFRHFNEPISMGTIDRMEGREQPKALTEKAETN